jgi:hypothetical protein
LKDYSSVAWDRRKEITAKFLNDKEFQDAVGKRLLKGVCHEIHGQRQEITAVAPQLK